MFHAELNARLQKVENAVFSDSYRPLFSWMFASSKKTNRIEELETELTDLKAKYDTLIRSLNLEYYECHEKSPYTTTTKLYRKKKSKWGPQRKTDLIEE